MAKNIYLIGGSKGGVGKSIVTMATVDYLQSLGETVLLIESDTSNPDVYKAYQQSTRAELLNLDEADGWIQLVNLCDAEPDSVIVLNTAARNNKGVSAYGETLNSTLAELKRSSTAPPGPTCENSFAARAEPNCTEAIAPTTSPPEGAFASKPVRRDVLSP